MRQLGRDPKECYKMIPVKNVFYMLAYAFSVLKSNGYKHIETEEFDNICDLFSEILATGTAIQIKRGLVHDYVPIEEFTSSIKGKINLTASLKSQSIIKKQLSCTYDEFTPDNYMNRVLKSTMKLLLRQNIGTAQSRKLKKVLVFFDGITELNLHNINWKFCYNRNNQTYRMLMSICYLVVHALLQSKSEGSRPVMDFIDEQHMHRLYEKFILEYYRKEWPELSSNASRIPWVLDDGYDELLPIMQTDITLSKGNKVLIIDAKYYTNTMQYRFDRSSIHSGNLYQIFTYVKNKEAALSSTSEHMVAGMLLYAKTDDGPTLDNSYSMSGNKITTKTLDLNRDFFTIKQNLDNIAKDHFKLS